MPARIVNSPFVRRAFTRFRFGGVAAQTIPRAWLRILGPIGGAPQILDPVEGENQTLAAFIRVQNVFAVRVADVLKESASGRLFVVRQVQPEPGRTDLLHCVEIQAPIPDEFNAQSLEAFWTQTTTGFSISNDGPSEPVLLLSTMPAGTLPSSAKGNYQLVSGDFDVWTRLRSDSGSTANKRHALLGARHPSSGLGCYVGARDLGGQGATNPVRLDEHATSTLDTTVGEGAVTATPYYMRLKRTGSRFQVFYRLITSAPESETDWTEIFNDPATSFSSTDDLRVGLFGYTDNGTDGQALWYFLRNWSASPSSIEFGIGRTVAGGSVGSVLFVGSGGALAQDNLNLFWDDTNNRLAIGLTQAFPDVALHVSGSCIVVGVNAGDNSLKVLAAPSQTVSIISVVNDTESIALWRVSTAPWQTMSEATTDPTTAILTAGNHFSIYRKNDKFVIAYNNAGTITYLTIPLDATTTTWTQSTTAP